MLVGSKITAAGSGRPSGRSIILTGSESELGSVTGVQLSPVVELDHRPIGGGRVGPVSREICDVYFKAVRGEDERFSHWLTPITR